MSEGRNMDENIASTNVQDNEQVEVTQKSLENTNTNTDDTAIAIIESNESIMKKSATSLSRPSIMCRICLNNGDIERLLTPCQCKGTQGYVHRGCLEYWLSTSGLSHCELCLFHFETIDCLRYGMWESMRIWFSHPSNRALLQSDIMLCTMLTFITFGLMVISMFAMYYLAGAPSENSAQVEATKYWMDTSVGVFLGIVMFAFLLNTAVVIKTNIFPWFRWWRRCKEIQLIIEDNNSNNSKGNP